MKFFSEHPKKGARGDSLILRWYCFTLMYALVQFAKVGQEEGDKRTDKCGSRSTLIVDFSFQGAKTMKNAILSSFCMHSLRSSFVPQLRQLPNPATAQTRFFYHMQKKAKHFIKYEKFQL